MITKVKLKNFKSFEDSVVDLAPDMNIVVGDNDSGKSTLLEAITLAATGRIDGKPLFSALSTHVINAAAVNDFIQRVSAGQNVPPLEMYVEVYLEPTTETMDLVGAYNSLNETSAGLRLEVSLDPNFTAQYKEFLKNRDEVKSFPIEYYRVVWKNFADGFATPSNARLTVSLIDASRIRLSNGTDYYLQRIIADGLNDTQRVQLARAYRDHMNSFGSNEDIHSINQYLDERKDDVSSKALTLGIDTATADGWQTALTPFLDSLPVHAAGNGERNMLKILLALNRQLSSTNVILIEEPENHLSFSSLNDLIGRIRTKSDGKQVIMTTHSSYVINKLGLSQLMLLSNHRVTRLSDLPSDTQNYFMKLPGFDTLRMVLAKEAILVEGPSDELIVQRAYLDEKGYRPIEKGVDVIAVSGLAFKRFLDIAVRLQRKTVVVTDNDEKPEAVRAKYNDYFTYPFINICFSEDPSLPTLEPQLVEVNDLVALAAIVGRPSNVSKTDLLQYMKKNKTESALKIHDSSTVINMPEYIREAVNA